MKKAVFVAGILMGAASVMTQAVSPSDLRAKAKESIQPLPDHAPGSQNDSKDKIDLGKRLYFEKKLSVNNTISCNSCHVVDGKGGGVDNQPTSPGAHGKRGGRNSPTSLNSAFSFAQFWDGRAENLKAQAKGPILNPIEMAMPSEAAVLEKLGKDPSYVKAFAKAFPGGASLTYDNLAEAIASFERTLITRDRFDDFLNGDDKALNAAETRGLELFLNTGCTTCHQGPLLGGTSYQKIGLVNAYENTKDAGRADVTKDEDDKFKFKVPTLRNIALTGPYFHDGSQKTVKETVSKMAWLQLGKQLTDTEADAITAFLNALTDKARSR